MSAEVSAFFKSYAQAWKNNDPEAIAEHWDLDDPKPLYKAEEIPAFLSTPQALQDYWQHNRDFHDAAELKFSQFEEKPLTEELSVVVTLMSWQIAFAPNTKTQDGSAFAHAGKTMGGENHVLTILKQTPKGLKLICWSETPDAPITYMGRLYEWAGERF